MLVRFWGRLPLERAWRIWKQGFDFWIKCYSPRLKESVVVLALTQPSGLLQSEGTKVWDGVQISSFYMITSFSVSFLQKPLAFHRYNLIVLVKIECHKQCFSFMSEQKLLFLYLYVCVSIAYVKVCQHWLFARLMPCNTIFSITNRKLWYFGFIIY